MTSFRGILNTYHHNVWLTSVPARRFVRCWLRRRYHRKWCF